MKKIIAVLILGLVGFCIYAEEAKALDQCSGTYKTYTSEMKKPVKVNESKLTSLNYIKKLGKPIIKESIKESIKDGLLYYSVDEKVFLCKAKDTKTNGTIKVGVAIVDGEAYARLVYRIPGLLKMTYNLHDTKCSISGRLAVAFNEEDTIDEFKGIINDFVKDVCE